VVNFRVKSLANPVWREPLNLRSCYRRVQEDGTMWSEDSESRSRTRAAAQFATTHWSVVATAGDASSPQAFEALETLCRTY